MKGTEEQTTGRFVAGELSRALEKVVSTLSSGRVKVMQPGANRYVLFTGKKIRALTSELDQERLGSWLVDRGFVSQDPMELALTNKKSNERLGSLLVRHGLLTDLQLFEELHNLSIAIAGRMLFEEGHYEVDPDATVPDDACTLELSPAALFLTACREIPDAGQFEMLVGGGRRFRARVQGAVSYGDVTYLPQEDLVLRALYRDLTFTQLCKQVDFEPKDLARCVVSLIVGGLVESTGMVVEKKPFKSPAEPETPSLPTLPPRPNQPSPPSRTVTDIKYAATTEPLKPLIRPPADPPPVSINPTEVTSGSGDFSVELTAPVSSASPPSGIFPRNESKKEEGFPFRPSLFPPVENEPSPYEPTESGSGFGEFQFENEQSAPTTEQNYGGSVSGDSSEQDTDLSWAPATMTEENQQQASLGDEVLVSQQVTAKKLPLEGFQPPALSQDAASEDDYEKAEAARKEAFELIAVGGDLRRVVKLLMQAVVVIPDPAALVKLAQLEQANPMWRQRALDHLKKAVEVSPRSTEAWLELANYWGVRGQKEKQARCLHKILMYEPSNRVVKETLNHLVDEE